MLDTDKRTISIEDNATGICAADFEKTLADIANSDKKLGEDKGFRGIGRLCGLAYCKELVFTSTAEGENIISIMRYHEGSAINSAFNKIDSYKKKKAELQKKRERGDFVDQNHFQEAVADVEKAKVTAEKAVKDIEKKKSRTENEPDSVVGQVIAHIEKERKKQETAKVEKTIKKSKQPTLAKRRVDITLPTYNRSERKLISKIFGIIVSATDEKTAEKIIRKIEDELQ